LNSQLKQIKKDTLTKFAAIKWTNPGAFTFIQKKYLLQYDLASKKLSLKDSVLLPDDAENMDASPNEDYTAYTQKFNLFLYHNHQSTQITDDGTRELVYGRVCIVKNLECERNFLVTEREPIGFLPYGSKHGDRLSDC